MDEGSIGRLNDLQAQNLADLAQFLNADLDLAFTMLQTAQIETKFDPQEVPAILGRVGAAIRTVRHLTGRIQDRTAWSKLHSRTDELEAKLAKLFGDQPTPEQCRSRVIASRMRRPLQRIRRVNVRSRVRVSSI